MSLLRIVRMHFRPESLSDFLELFDEVKQQIKNYPGCEELKLMQDANNPCVVYTYSRWDSEKDLNSYRNSPFFAETWKRTKILFEEKAQAFSLLPLQDVKN